MSSGLLQFGSVTFPAVQAINRVIARQKTTSLDLNLLTEMSFSCEPHQNDHQREFECCIV